MSSNLASSTGPSAASAYRLGVTLLLDGRQAEATEAFRLAVTEDQCFALGHAALAAALHELDEHESSEAIDALDRARHCSRRVTRRERHHVEVVTLALRGQHARASALGREHLVDFPDDAVVRHVLTRWT